MGALKDDDLMPFGKFQNTKMEDVPAWYLLWLKDQKPRVGDKLVRDYIEENLDALELEQKSNKKR